MDSSSSVLSEPVGNAHLESRPVQSVIAPRSYVRRFRAELASP
jgi:hypothetical protein